VNGLSTSLKFMPESSNGRVLASGAGPPSRYPVALDKGSPGMRTAKAASSAQLLHQRYYIVGIVTYISYMILNDVTISSKDTKADCLLNLR
jgi:hypothetical protein